VVLMLPTYYPVTNKNFNYAPVMLFGTIILALIAWVVSVSSALCCAAPCCTMCYAVLRWQ